jgi:hypothetical protein
MHKIIKDYVQAIPASKFIGIKYGDKDRVDGGFGFQWDEWVQNHRFEKLEELLTEDFNKTYEDFNAYVGLMRCKEGEPFEYWIGMFLPKESTVPHGFDSVDMEAGKLGVCWIQGTMDELFFNEEECGKRLCDKGYEVISDKEGAWWFFERYGCPRFIDKDEEGRVILDICHYIK